jgi:hypothetical protein
VHLQQGPHIVQRLVETASGQSSPAPKVKVPRWLSRRGVRERSKAVVDVHHCQLQCKHSKKT